MEKLFEFILKFIAENYPNGFNCEEITADNKTYFVLEDCYSLVSLRRFIETHYKEGINLLNDEDYFILGNRYDVALINTDLWYKYIIHKNSRNFTFTLKGQNREVIENN